MWKFASASRTPGSWRLRKRGISGGLLDLDGAAGGFDLLLDVVGFRLRHAFLEGLGGAFDEGLRFGEAEAGDRRADFLDDRNLLGRVGGLEDDVEGGLLFGRGRGGSTTTSGGRDGHRSGGADAPLGFELFDEVSDFQDGQAAEL